MKNGLLIMICFLFILQGCSMEGTNNISVETEEGVRMDQQLIEAAASKDTALIIRLIEAGANIDAQDSQGRTAVMIATYNHDVASAKALIESGANVNLQDDMKNSPFLYAGAEGYLDILKLTIQAGADPTITNRFGGTALIPASEHGYVEVVKELLITTKIDVNHINNLGWTALLEAIILNNGDQKQQETIKLLIQHGADVNISDYEQVTPLKHAHDRGFKEIVQVLEQAGARF